MGDLPERMRVFCKVSLPKKILPTSGGAAFVNVNLPVGPFDESSAPTGPQPTTVDAGGILSSRLGSLVRVGVALWGAFGEAQPGLHAGAEVSLHTDLATLFAQVQFQDRISCAGSSPLCAWGLLGTFGLTLPVPAAPTSLHVSLGRGDAVPRAIVALESGITYDVHVRARYGDGIAAVERGWDRLFAPLRYRMRLRQHGYYDPYPDDQGLLRDDRDHSVLGILGIPDPRRPGHILTPAGISIPVGASLEIRGDRPFVASPAFPGQVLTYIPLLALTKDGGAMPRLILDETYFARLEDERRREELALQDELRRMDSPWAKAALNAATSLLTEPMLMFLAAASPDSPDLQTLRRQARLLSYRNGYEEYKGELAEAVLATYGSLLAGVAEGPLRMMAAATARELAAGLSSLRMETALGAASRTPQLLTRLAPRLNPGNYRVELTGLGSNLGNVKVRYAGAATELGLEEAEHLQPLELAMPALSEKTRSHIFSGDVLKGKSTGWHYEPTGDASVGTYVVAETRSAPDVHGVYVANVYIQGVKKNARSSFFPSNWTPQQVEAAIEEAYRTRQAEKNPGIYRGRTASGMEIEMNLDAKGKVRTAYPIYQGDS